MDAGLRLWLHVTRYVTVTFPPYALGHKLISLEYLRQTEQRRHPRGPLVHPRLQRRALRLGAPHPPRNKLRCAWLPSTGSRRRRSLRAPAPGLEPTAKVVSAPGLGRGFALGPMATLPPTPGREDGVAAVSALGLGRGFALGPMATLLPSTPSTPAHPAPEIRPPPAPAPPKIDVAHPPIIPKPAPHRRPARLLVWCRCERGAEQDEEPNTARAVEAEVTRRLQERESELEAEREGEGEEEGEGEGGQLSGQPTKSPKRTRERELPPGLTPLLKRHKDLDDELQSRLAELERKVSVSGPCVSSRSFLVPVFLAMLTCVVV
ncbi:hypothetical protein B0H14DRAFT_3494248 [Mycena olivaceomarginata]|nr:hypothetical protein B0H14DRAFT_3494248 [Mycena olivaceomarginata]